MANQNKTTIIAEPGKQEMLITREFDAPLETLILEELPGGRTRLTAQSVFQSVADCDGALQSGMEEGLTDSHERLAQLLETL
jgi:hypothetical protein